MYDLFCFGWIRLDTFFHIDDFPQKNFGLEVDTFYDYISGDATVVAFHSSSLGCKVALSGNSIGSDLKGQKIKEILKRQSIDCFFANKISESPSNIVIQDKNDNRTWFGLNCKSVRKTALNADIRAIKNTKVVYVDGNLGEASYKVVLKAKELGKFIILNMGDESIYQFAKVHIIPIHILSIKPVEFLKRNPPRESNIRIITCGKEGAYFASSKKIYYIAAHEISSINPSGAGAAFAAGICYSIINNFSLEYMAKFSSACGALHCEDYLYNNPISSSGIQNKLSMHMSLNEIK